MNAIFLGTFNPPHIGHLNCIQSVLDHEISKNITKIHIIPCNQNPNKEGSIDFDIRFKMCQELFKGFSNKVVVNDIERDHKWIFTYDMLEYLSNDNDKSIGKDFLWILTEETYYEILYGSWHNSLEILSKYIDRMIIIGTIKPELEKYFSQICKCKAYVNLMPGFEMHSIDIRNLVKQGKSINLYTNQKVIDIIENEKLYK